jgi:purine-nucleoside phosphorylase
VAAGERLFSFHIVRPDGAPAGPREAGEKYSMKSFKKEATEAAAFVSSRFSDVPTVGLLAGTGLGDSFGEVEIAMSLGYGEIPEFPRSTVQGHRGRFLFGRLAGHTVMAMQGRFHYYEGYGMEQITLPIRVMQLMGVKTLLIVNAAGGINPAFVVGDMMVIADHINLTGNNPLIGPNIDEWGPRFPDMTAAYDPELISLAETTGLREGMGLKKGVYAGLSGPSLETRAEIRFLRGIGADAVGLSTIPEVIAAVHGGLRVFGVSVITNMNLPDNPIPCSVDDIIAVAERTTPKLRDLIKGILEALSNDAG